MAKGLYVSDLLSEPPFGMEGRIIESGQVPYLIWMLPGYQVERYDTVVQA